MYYFKQKVWSFMDPMGVAFNVALTGVKGNQLEKVQVRI